MPTDPSTPLPPDAARIVADVVHRRRTEKVLQTPGTRPPLPEEVAAQRNQQVRHAVADAGMAPFHYPRNVDGLAEPWRAHILWRDAADRLAAYLRDDLGVTSKEPLLAAGCDALVIVTWLPEFRDEAAQQASNLPPHKQIGRDEEHLAAAAALTQNLLLLLTAHGLGTYWSSGGRLRNPEVFARLGIPAAERFVAGVFIEYPESADAPKDRRPGALRDQRSDAWFREVNV
ncbi:MAG: nitroreductase family protein [Planctomycetota bacterium]